MIWVNPYVIRLFFFLVLAIIFYIYIVFFGRFPTLPITDENTILFKQLVIFIKNNKSSNLLDWNDNVEILKEKYELCNNRYKDLI